MKNENTKQDKSSLNRYKLCQSGLVRVVCQQESDQRDWGYFSFASS